MRKSAVGYSANDGSAESCSERATPASAYLDAAIRVVLLLYVAVLPFKGLLVLERNGFLLLLVLLLAWCLLNGKLFYRKTPFDRPLLVFLSWVGFTLPFASFPEYSLKEYGKLLQWVVVFYAVLSFLSGPTHRKILLCLLGLVSSIALGFGLTQLNLHNPQGVVGPFQAEVWFTTFLVMVIPFGLAAAFGAAPTAVKGAGVGLGILAAACLLGTQSRAGLVTLLVELSAMAWLIRTKSAKIAAGILIVCLMAVTVLGLYIKDSSPSGPASDLQRSIPVKTGVATIVHRLDIWKFTLTEIGKNWLVGIGYGPNAYLYRYGQEGETVEPGHTTVKERGTHNILLYLSLHVGVIGMVLFVWFYGLATLTTVREYRNAVDWTAKLMLAGMIVSMIGLFVRLQFDQMFVGSLAIFFWVLLAAAALHYPSLRQDASER